MMLNTPFHRILGTPISIVSMEQVLQLFKVWTINRCDRYVVLRDVHGVVRALSDVRLQKAHEQADLTTPDGLPIVWTARLAGVSGISRVCGPDLLPAVCECGLSLGWRHYFLGGAPGVAERMIDRLKKDYPGIRVVGLYCPPFRPLSMAEDEILCANIRSADPDFVWVGLGTPKQEIWMHEHRGRCGGSILLGVGAAFDIHAGVKSRGPNWMQSSGLEWAYRLIQEPKRLWHRYLVLAPMYIFFVLLEFIRGSPKQIEIKRSLPIDRPGVSNSSAFLGFKRPKRLDM